LQRVLAGEGHEVVVEKRGDDGLTRASETPFNVVITDLRLPGLSGLELVQQLHTARPRLPIILITAFGTAKTAIEATKLGAYDMSSSLLTSRKCSRWSPRRRIATG